MSYSDHPLRLHLPRLLLAVAVTTCTPASVSAAGFARGADVGWLPQMEESGFVFRDRKGEPAGCLQILKDHGIDTLRLRVFVHPSAHPRSGHCSRDEVVALAVRARRLGFRLLINFHYSDSWADPAHQKKPAAWATHTYAELKDDVFNHTRDVLGALKAQCVTPEWVQVGNEITDGLLWPEGKLENPDHLSGLLEAGYRAVKASDPSIKVVLHLDRGNEPVHCRAFFDALKTRGTPYDVIGLSYYPFWLESDYTATISDLGKNLTDLAARYGKEVMIVEVGGESAKPENTHALLAAVLETVRAVPDQKGLGVIYWEPQAATSWSHYKLSCWGADGRPTMALDAFREGAMPGTLAHPLPQRSSPDR